MDDVKQAIYLDVLDTLHSLDGRTHICVQLQWYLEDVFGIITDRSQTSLTNLLTEFFPEFFALYDGYQYDIDWRRKQHESGSWFAPSARHARISLVNFLLTHR